MYPFKTIGVIKYDPTSSKSAFLPFTCVLRLDDSIAHYYRWWAKKVFGVQLNFPIWKFHTTIVRAEKPKIISAWKKYEGETVEISYSPEIKNAGVYFWISVKSGKLCEIRKSLGLSPFPRVDFHATLGNTKHIDQSKVKKTPLPTRVFPWEKEENFRR